MKALMSNIIHAIDTQNEVVPEIINWASPVLCFGDLLNSKIATVGINPSNLEFIDKKGIELNEQMRRFPTLNSLSLETWRDIDSWMIDIILDSYKNYFNTNPYDAWFKKLDFLISGTSHSYYFPLFNACHIDLVPFSTRIKWSNLPTKSQQYLLSSNANFIGEAINCANNLEFLILNGSTVIKQMTSISDFKPIYVVQPKWELKQRRNNIKGVSINGEISRIGKTQLSKKIKVLGFNYNIQSSFGITKEIQSSIRNWLVERIKLNQ